MVTASNRRSFYRHPMNLQVSLRVSGVRGPVPAMLIDLSGGGGMLIAKQMLRAPVAVEFDLPRKGAPPLRLPGRIQKATFLPADRTFKYAVEFDALDEGERESLLRYISAEQRRLLRSSGEHPDRAAAEPRASEQRAHRRIDVTMPVRIAITDVPGAMEGIALDLSTGGARIACGRVLRQEWEITIYLMPPDGRDIKLRARALPGVKPWRGQYIQSVIWVDPDPAATRDIDRVVRSQNSKGQG